MNTLFPLGQVVATPSIMKLVEEGLLLDLYIWNHHHGIWGDLCNSDKKANLDALKHGARILSAYNTPFGKIYIITEADRSSTCILLPEEY